MKNGKNREKNPVMRLTALFYLVFLLAAPKIYGHVSEGVGEALQLYSAWYSGAGITLDGDVHTSDDEWDAAFCREIELDDGTKAYLYLMNDANNLYAAVVYPWGNNGATNACYLYFDQGAAGGDHDDALSNNSENMAGSDRGNLGVADSGTRLDQYRTGGAWANDGGGVDFNVCVDYYTNRFNWEFKIPLDNGEADDLNVSGGNGTSTGDELGIYIEIVLGGGGGTRYWKDTNGDKNDAGSGAGWGDLRLGKPKSFVTFGATMGDVNGYPAIDGDITGDDAWRGVYNREITLTDFSGSTMTANVYFVADGTNDNIYFGAKVYDTSQDNADNITIYQEQNNPSSNPETARNYVLENNQENALSLTGGGTKSDKYWANGAPGSWTADGDGGGGNSGAAAYSTDHWEFETKLEDYNNGANTEDLDRLDDSALIGFQIKYVDVTSGSTFWWEYSANSDAELVDDNANVTLSLGWAYLQLGAPYLQIVHPSDGTTVDGTYPIDVYAVPSATVKISSVVYQVEGATTWTNMTQVASTSTYSYWWSTDWNTTGKSDGTYELRVKATDSNALEVNQLISVTIDNSGGSSSVPTVSVTSPGAGSFVRNTLNMGFTASLGTGGAAITDTEISVDGGTYSNVDNSPPAGGGAGSHSINTKTLADGSHIARVRSEQDGAGRYGYSEVRLFVVDNSSPSLTPQGVEGATYSDDYNFARNGDSVLISVKAEDYVSAVSTVVLDASAIGKSFINLVDDGSCGDLISGDGVYSSTLTVNAMAGLSGAATFYFYGTDIAGNTTPAVTGSIEIDNSTPTVNITSPLSTAISSAAAGGSVDITYSYTEKNPRTITVEIYDGTGVIGTSVFETINSTSAARTDTVVLQNGISEGLKSSSVTVRDKAGNVEIASSINSIRIDNTKPVVQPESPVPGSLISDVTPLITALFSETGAGIDTGNCSVSVDGSTAAAVVTVSSVTYQAGALSDGVHTVSVDVKDSAGNQSDTLIWSFTVDSTSPETISVTRISPSYYIQASSTLFTTGSIEVESTAGDGVSISSVTFYDDSGYKGVDLLAPYTTSWAPSEGLRGIYVIAGDSMTNTTKSQIVNVVVDNSNPSQPIILSPSASAFLKGTIGVKFSAADTYGLSKVEFYNNNVLSGSEFFNVTSSSGEFSYDTTASTDGVRTLRVTAYDNVGNSNSSNISVTVDNTAPTATIQTLASPTSGYVRVDYTYGETNVDKVEFYVDGGLVDTDNSPGGSPEFFNWYSTKQADGGHMLKVKVYDLAGNSGESAGKAVIIDNNSPQSAVIAMIMPEYSVEGSTLGYLNGTFTVEAALADSVAPAQVEFFRDGGVSLGIDSGGAPWTISTTTVGMDGHHSIYCVVTDTGTNTLQSNPVHLIYDNTVPSQVNIFYPSTGTYHNGTIGVKVSAADTYGLSRVELYDNSVLSGSNLFSTVGSTTQFVYDTKSVADGNHILMAAAYDNVNNSLTSSSITVIVDNLAPSATIQTLASPTSGYARVNYSYTEANVDKVEFYIDGALVETDGSPGASPQYFNWYSTKQADGGHMLKVKVYDLAGNSGESAGKTVIIDNNAPQSGVISVIYPSYVIEGDTLSYVKGTVTVEAAIADTVATAQVEFFRDGGASLGIDSDGAPWKTSWNTTGLDGHHTVYCVVTDTGTNTLQSDAVNIVIDNTSPAVTINPVTTPTKISNQTISGTYAETNLKKLLVNGVEAACSGGSYSATVPLIEGSNTITAYIEDKTGNTASSSTSIFYDPNSPVSIVRPTDGAKLKGTATVEVVARQLTQEVWFEVSPDSGTSWYNLAGIASTRTVDSNYMDGWIQSWDTTWLGGSTNYHVRVYSYSSEAATPTISATSVNITVDNDAPVVVFSTSSFTPLPKLTGTTYYVYSPQTRLKINVTDALSGMGSVKVKNVNASGDKIYYADVTPADDGDVVQYIPLVEGKNVISVESSDVLGNTAAVSSFTICYADPKTSAVISPAGGTVAAADGTKVVLPDGALHNDTKITINVVNKEDLPEPTDPDIRLIGVGRDFGPSGTVFAKPVDITMVYSDADLDQDFDGTPEFDESKLNIVFWDGWQWINVGASSRDAEGNSLTAKVNHFTIYAIAEITASTPTVTNVFLTRNPFRVADGTDFIYDLISDAKVSIKIFDLAGDMVCELTDKVPDTTGRRSKHWAGLNEFGNYVGSGIYIYIAEIEYSGGRKEILKGTIGVVK